MRKMLLPIAICLFTIIFVAAANASVFTTATSIAVPATSNSFVVGDFNHDGNLDVVIVEGRGKVETYLGNGKGGFVLSAIAPVTSNAETIVAGDFNHDGYLDIAVGGANNTGILLGNGDGTFQKQKSYTPYNVHAMQVADFNGDGNPDLLINGSEIMLGNADGTFRKPTAFGAYFVYYQDQMAVGDFNGDGKMDFALLFVEGVTPTLVVQLGNGDGTFQTPLLMILPGYYISQGMTVADFNKDGKLDLAVAACSDQYCQNPATINMLLGNGDGTFQLSTVRAVIGQKPGAVLSSDFNHDGNPDLVTVNGSSDMTVWTGRGDGTFNTSASWSLPGGPGIAAIGDFNNDGNPDVMMFTRGNNHVFLTIAFGKLGVAFDAPFESFAPSATLLVSGDFNEDGKLDVVATDGLSNKATFLAGKGNGALRAAGQFVVSPTVFDEGAEQIAVADVNHDRHLDLLVVVGPAKPGLGLLLGTGNGTFNAGTRVNVGPNPVWVAVGDFNGDGKMDLAVANAGNHANGALVIALGNGDGTFQAPVRVDIGPHQPISVSAADLNGDGKLDLIVVNSDNVGSLETLLGNGDGTFQVPSTPVTLQKYPLGQVAVGDLNGDGKPDVVVLINDQTTNIYVLPGNGDGTFQTPQTYSLTAGPPYGSDAPILGDFNGDGNLDIAAPFGCCTVGVTGIDILFGNGHGSFLLGTPILLSPLPMIGGDFNGDGKLDLAFSNPYSSEVSIVLNK